MRMDGLEAKPRRVRDDRDRTWRDDATWQQRPDEQAPDFGRRLRLEDQTGAHPYDTQVRMLTLQQIQVALERGLVPRIERAGDPVGRPGFIDETVLGPRGIRTDR